MKTLTQSPLRRYREQVCQSRAEFCRRHRLGYQSTALAEIGLVPHPSNLIRVLSNLTQLPEPVLLAEHKSWLESCPVDK